MRLITSGRLYKQYPGQCQPQNVVADVYADGDNIVHYNPEIGNAVPSDVWHGLVRRYTLHNVTTREDARRWYRGNRDDLIIVINGLSREWGGSNHVGKLTPEARDAEEQIEYNCYTGGYSNY